MFVTFDVLNPLTSRLVNVLQLKNIKFIFVTLDVSKTLISKVVNFDNLLNNSDEFSGA